MNNIGYQVVISTTWEQGYVLSILEGALLNYFERLTTISDSSDAPGTSDWSGVSDELKDSIANSACCILKCLQQT